MKTFRLAFRARERLVVGDSGVSSEEGFVVGGGGCETPPPRVSSEGEACGGSWWV